MGLALLQLWLERCLGESQWAQGGLCQLGYFSVFLSLLLSLSRALSLVGLQHTLPAVL